MNRLLEEQFKVAEKTIDPCYLPLTTLSEMLLLMKMFYAYMENNYDSDVSGRGRLPKCGWEDEGKTYKCHCAEAGICRTYDE